MRLRHRRLLLDRHGFLVLIEFHYAVAFRIVDVIAEHARTFTALGHAYGLAQRVAQTIAVEDVVTKHKRARLSGDELFAEDERLCQTVGAGLHLVGEVHAIMRSVTEQTFEVRQVLRRGDDQNVTDTRQHQHRQRIIDHRLVVDGEQLLRRDRRQRVQTGTRTASQNNALHQFVPFLHPPRLPSRRGAFRTTSRGDNYLLLTYRVPWPHRTSTIPPSRQACIRRIRSWTGLARNAPDED